VRVTSTVHGVRQCCVKKTKSGNKRQDWASLGGSMYETKGKNGPVYEYKDHN
jgi:hypothetical protein